MSDQQKTSGTLRRTVIKTAAGAVGTAVIGSGALLYGTESAAAAADGVDTGATVELDSNQRDVTGVTIAPAIGFEWSDFSNGVDHFQLDVEVTTEAGLSEDAMNDLLPEGESIDAGTILDGWSSQSSEDSGVDVVSSSEFGTDGSNNSEVPDVTTGSETNFTDASGTGTVNLTEQSLTSTLGTSYFPQGVGDGEAAGTRVSVDITLDIRYGSTNNTNHSEATIDYDTIEFGIIVDNPSSDASEGDTTMNSSASGE